MARIRAARHYQHPRALVRQVADAGRRATARPMRESLTHLGEMLDGKRALELVRSGRHREIAREAVDWSHFREVLKAPFEKIAQTYEAGAQVGVVKINRAFRQHGRVVRFKKHEAAGGGPSGLNAARQSDEDASALADRLVSGGPGRTDHSETDTVELADLGNLFNLCKAVGDRFNFDRFTDATQARLRSDQNRLIKDLDTQARDTIETVVLQAQQAGDSPEEIVDQIRSVIGLTANQATAVLNYRRLLQDGSSDALRRALRDPKYDDAVRAAQDAGEDLDAALIDDMVDEYASRYLSYRAATIAGTESVRAANGGLRDAYRQAVERGAIPTEAITRFWQISLEENVCPICEAIPDINPEGVGVDEPFDSDVGPVDDPPDPHPGCRCSVEYVTNLDLVPDEGEA